MCEREIEGERECVSEKGSARESERKKDIEIERERMREKQNVENNEERE